MAENQIEKVANLAKRRGFIFPSSELYGGLAGFWDFGPLGTELKNNLKRVWWKRFVVQRDDVVGLDSSIITNPKVWEASGHIDKFFDYLSECKKCHQRAKLDILKKGGVWITAEGEELKDINCKNCGASDWTEPKTFNTMFKTLVGPVEETASTAHLRPETAQGIFVNFETIRQTMRLSLPFGIAQIGKAFRNEITPGNFIFRSREFEQMELEYFVAPGTDDEWFERWVKASHQFFLDLGLNPKRLRLHEQSKVDLAHYSKATTDIEYEFGFEKGWAELTGIANRQDFDLKQHGRLAKGDEQAFAVDGKVPYVIEPSFGVDRAVMAFLLDAYEEIKGGRTTTTESTKESEVVLRLHKSLAPYKAAVLPLSKKPELASVAQELAQTLRKHFMIDYDETSSIGRRYRRQDEIGTPFCITVDFESLEDKKATIRNRDTMQQERIALVDIPAALKERLEN